MKKFIIFLIIILINLGFVSSSIANIQFNGRWSNGTTLYSDWIELQDVYIFGKDAYPDRKTISVNFVCENKTINYYEPVCEIQNIRGHIRNVCHRELKTKTVESCKKIRTKTSCLNPDGKFTNQLKLMNFAYSFDNITWNNIPYENSKNKTYIVNSSVLFRLIIPAECYPVYYYNKAVFVEN